MTPNETQHIDLSSLVALVADSLGIKARSLKSKGMLMSSSVYRTRVVSYLFLAATIALVASVRIASTVG